MRGRAEQDLRALGRGHVTPAFVRPRGRVDRAIDVCAVGVLEDADQLICVGGIAVLERLAGGGFDPLAVDEVAVGGR